MKTHTVLLLGLAALLGPIPGLTGVAAAQEPSGVMARLLPEVRLGRRHPLRRLPHERRLPRRGYRPGLVAGRIADRVRRLQRAWNLRVEPLRLVGRTPAGNRGSASWSPMA